MTPKPGTLEHWLWQYLTTTDSNWKLNPPEASGVWEDAPPRRCLESPGRPPEWNIVQKAPKTIRKGACVREEARVRLMHTFLHHELQAAELMAWAALSFPDTPLAFRRGLLKICQDEIRHMKLYQDYMQARGVSFGDHPIRDWFWSRVPKAKTPAEFVATMGIGLEGGNLDHSDRYVSWFEEVGDDEGAAMLRVVRDEEVGHVRFAAMWFTRFTGGLSFQEWAESLPKPLSPLLMKGRPMNRADRLKAGLAPEFLDLLEAY